MKIRLKFTKEGQVKFVGHLDMIRLFQRAIKVAQIPIAYSQGFNPHSLVYFAMPLSVGVSSKGEYMDIVTSKEVLPDEVKDRLNAVLVEGIKILDAFEVSDQTASLMSLVHAADYEIILQETDEEKLAFDSLKYKLEQSELFVSKKGKKGMKEVDIKPLILSCVLFSGQENKKITMKVLAGSAQNLSPQLFLEAVFGETMSKNQAVGIMRKELYINNDGSYIPLDKYRRE